MKYNFLETANNYYDEAIRSLVDLLRYKSVLDEYVEDGDAPFGIECKKALHHMLKMAENDGFKVKNVDNYAGHIEYGEGKEIVGVLGHLDVVPAVGKWTNDPFDPTIRDGKLYARGTLDDKGGVIASYYALKMLKDLNVPLSKRVRIIVGCDEETGSRCMERYFKKETMPDLGFSPDAEFPVIYGEKGILTFDILGKVNNREIVSLNAGERYNIVPDLATLEVKNAKQEYLDAFVKKTGCKASLEGNTYSFYGKAAHAMQPQDGVNAIMVMMEFMNEYYPCDVASYLTKYHDNFGNKQGIDIDDKDMHNLTINLAICKYAGKDLKLGYNLRVPTDEHVEVIKEGFTRCLNEFGSDLHLENINYSKRHFIDPNGELIQGLMHAYQEISGDYESKPFTIGGGTYARILKNAVAFGPNFPGRPDICHQPDEHIYLEDFVKWIAIFALAIYELAK